MKQSEGNPLIRRQYDTFTNTLIEGGTRRSPPNDPMHFPQHQQADPAEEDSNDSLATRANNTRGATSRQLPYIDRLPQLPSESRDYSRTNVPVTSTESSESSSSPVLQPSSIHLPQTPQQHHHQQQHNFAFDSTRLGAPGPLPVQPSLVVPPRSSPQHTHNDYNNMQRNLHSPATSNNALDSATRTHGRFIRTDDGALIEVSEEVYAVRQAALAVLDPITYCWVRCHCHFYFCK